MFDWRWCVAETGSNNGRSSFPRTVWSITNLHQHSGRQGLCCLDCPEPMEVSRPCIRGLQLVLSTPSAGQVGYGDMGGIICLGSAEWKHCCNSRTFRQYRGASTKMRASDYIWLSSTKAAKELMDKKYGVYSSRPPLLLGQGEYNFK